MCPKRMIVPQAKIALDSFKEEIAREMGLEDATYAGYVGGMMVKRMVEFGEKSLVSHNIGNKK